ncbi:MAG: tRNA (adenine-N1)-methyltransferase [Chloroflexi bacterium]|nr:tRNA (adenine-N1)-methyltransferase [Chloroflexota bacterium]
MTDEQNLARENDYILLLGPDERHHLARLQATQRFDTHYGFILHKDIIGKPFGSAVRTQLGHPYLLLQPSSHDLVRYIKRNSQIIFPKEIGYIILRMNIVPGTRVVEAGTGSGGLTLALARQVAPNGRVYSYEAREDMQAIARKNLERVGALDAVELKLRDIREGFDERHVDALFLDVREPWLYLAQARAALKGGGFFGALVPTTNQLTDLLQEIDAQGTWADIEVVEILTRHYKINADRLRPEDRMVAHTGYLLFARAVARLEKMEIVSAKSEEEKDAVETEG